MTLIASLEYFHKNSHETFMINKYFTLPSSVDFFLDGGDAAMQILVVLLNSLTHTTAAYFFEANRTSDLERLQNIFAWTHRRNFES